MSPIRRVCSGCALGFLRNDPPSNPDRKVINEATASSEFMS